MNISVQVGQKDAMAFKNQNDQIKVNDFSVYYEKFQAVKNVTCGFKKGAVTAMIGPSGCGKSTLLRAINRMNDLIPICHTTGEIIIDDLNIYSPRVDVVKLRQQVGMVFQKPNIFPKSIYDNITFGPKLLGIKNKATLNDIVEQSLQQAAIWDEVKDRLNNNALGMSGGQQQRLCLARALAVNPEVLLMDEPTSALDPKATASIEELISELREKYTIVIVTHNMQQAARVSDFTAFMYEGTLIEYGQTNQIFTNPKNQQTENYITGRFG